MHANARGGALFVRWAQDLRCSCPIMCLQRNDVGQRLFFPGRYTVLPKLTPEKYKERAAIMDAR